ncbi:leucine-rich repeat-containing protein 4C isoform X1 [Archocentrus centrarchus]|uniref:leucine-rich repeat-containing protein 4C isoform X1 n=1 Tax=Archocentrus centrarchus TaxID=63155 RepID=UPI0011E9E7E9|nr:leucine-rich repeat-containing protein 4C-like isoform X1 [Archocentrus centrarchus]
MASSGILSFIFTAFCITAVKSGDFVKVECKTKNLGHYGQQSLLECVVQTSKDVQDPVIRVVAWKKLSSPGDEDGKIMLAYSKRSSQTTQGYRFAEPSWNERNMNVSLLITNTAVTDEGLYSCMVITDSGDHTSFTTLNVQAKYSIPTILFSSEKIVPNSFSTLTCESVGGYPEGKLRWFDKDNYDWTGSAEMEVKQTDDGLLQLTSRLPLFQGSTSLKYTCIVFNASGVKEEESTIEIPEDSLSEGSTGEKQVETSKIVAPLVVIGSLIVGLLLVLLLYKKRAQHGHHAVHTSEHDVEAGDDQSHENKTQS